MTQRESGEGPLNAQGESSRMELVPGAPDGNKAPLDPLAPESRPGGRHLHALTLVQPWAWCISHGPKRVENREWSLDWLVGHYFAIHAGKKYDDAAAVNLALGWRALGLQGPPPGEESITLGAIVAVAKLAKFVNRAPYWKSSTQEDPWFSGPIGWVLEDVQAIEPVPCRGYQKLWTVPHPIAEQVRERWRLARQTKEAPP